MDSSNIHLTSHMKKGICMLLMVEISAFKSSIHKESFSVFWSIKVILESLLGSVSVESWCVFHKRRKMDNSFCITKMVTKFAHLHVRVVSVAYGI